jgi:hypothetical protein
MIYESERGRNLAGRRNAFLFQPGNAATEGRNRTNERSWHQGAGRAGGFMRRRVASASWDSQRRESFVAVQIPNPAGDKTSIQRKQRRKTTFHERCAHSTGSQELLDGIVGTERLRGGQVRPARFQLGSGEGSRQPLLAGNSPPDVPEQGRGILVGGCDGVAIRGECHGEHSIADREPIVAVEAADFFRRGDLPESNDAITSPDTSRRPSGEKARERTPPSGGSISVEMAGRFDLSSGCADTLAN